MEAVAILLLFGFAAGLFIGRWLRDADWRLGAHEGFNRTPFKSGEYFYYVVPEDDYVRNYRPANVGPAPSPYPIIVEDPYEQ